MTLIEHSFFTSANVYSKHDVERYRKELNVSHFSEGINMFKIDRIRLEK